MNVNKSLSQPTVAYVHCVFADKDFRDAINDLKNKYRITDKDNLSWDIGVDSVREFYVRDENHSAKRPLGPEFNNDSLRLADEYGITWQLVHSYIRGHTDYSQVPSAIINDIRTNGSDPPTFDLLVMNVATKQDVMDALYDFERQAKGLYDVDLSGRKRKGPQYMQLVYAVHKQRKAHKTFSQIHKEYLAGNLRGYTGPVVFTGLDKFRKYYRKYKPEFDDIPI